MALPNVQDIRNLSLEQIDTEIQSTRRALLDLRVKKALGKLEKTHEVKFAKRRLAHLMLVKQEITVSEEKV